MNKTQITDDIEEMNNLLTESLPYLKKYQTELECKQKSDIISSYDSIELKNLCFNIEDLLNKISK